MAEEKRLMNSGHSVTMQNREKIMVTGVVDVLSFDEESVVADTDMGMLMIRGANLHVNSLNLDHGELSVDGEVDALEYSDGTGLSKGRGSLFSKIFK